MANGRRGAKVPRIGADNLSFGERLRAMREKAGLSYADVAARSGISSQSIARYESVLTAEPEFYNGLAIATALGITPYALAGLSDPSPVPPALLFEGKTEERSLRQEILAMNERLNLALDRLAKLESVRKRRAPRQGLAVKDQS